MPYSFLILRPVGNVVVPLTQSGILHGALKLRALIPVSEKSVNAFLRLVGCAIRWKRCDEQDLRERSNLKHWIRISRTVVRSSNSLARLVQSGLALIDRMC